MSIEYLHSARQCGHQIIFPELSAQWGRHAQRWLKCHTIEMTAHWEGHQAQLKARRGHRLGKLSPVPPWPCALLPEQGFVHNRINMENWATVLITCPSRIPLVRGGEEEMNIRRAWHLSSTGRGNLHRDQWWAGAGCADLSSWLCIQPLSSWQLDIGHSWAFTEWHQQMLIKHYSFLESWLLKHLAPTPHGFLPIIYRMRKLKFRGAK